MKKLKLFLILLVCVGSMPSAMAQITQGTPSTKTIRTGNRPDAGTFGLYMGATSNMFKGLFDGNISVSALPLVNLKYMATDKFEIRAGIELFRSTEKLSGMQQSDYNNATTEVLRRYEEGTAMFYPGFAYHFSPNNIFDVYVGAELPIGWDSASTKSVSGADSEVRKKGSFVVGLGAFVGIQAFIANLPLALGLEYGFSGRLNASLKYKTVTTYGGQTQTVYSPDYNHFSHLNAGYGEGYDKLKAKVGGIGSQLRLTISYYFN